MTKITEYLYEATEEYQDRRGGGRGTRENSQGANLKWGAKTSPD